MASSAFMGGPACLAVWKNVLRHVVCRMSGHMGHAIQVRHPLHMIVWLGQSGFTLIDSLCFQIEILAICPSSVQQPCSFLHVGAVALFLTRGFGSS